MADLESDTFGADVLVLWESSRGSRKVGEWVTLIDWCEMRGVKIFVTTHERTYDPANGRDRRTLIEDATDSEYESYKVHKRVARTAASQAGNAGLLQVPQVRGLLVMPRIVSACSGSWWMARVVLATLSAPRSFRVPMARLRKLAMARGAFPA